MSNNSREYRATHEEKNGILKELKLIDDKLSDEMNKALEGAKVQDLEAIRSRPDLKALMKRYTDLKAEEDNIEREMRNRELHINHDDTGYYAQPGSCYGQQVFGAVGEKLKAQYTERKQELSKLRAAVNLANLRSEVKSLFEKAMKV